MKRAIWAIFLFIFSTPVFSTTISIDTSNHIRTIPKELFGTNISVYESSADDFGTSDYNDYVAATQLLGHKDIRIPGGLRGDQWDWEQTRSSGSDINTWEVDVFEMLQFIGDVGADADPLIIVNYPGYWHDSAGNLQLYGHTSAVAKAVAWVEYMNVTNSYDVKYWEIGNECFGNWHPQTTDGTTYGNNFCDFYSQMKAVDPDIKIGALAPTGSHASWTDNMMAATNAQGVVPDFFIEHIYIDSNVLTDGVEEPGLIAAEYDTKISNVYGASYVGQIEYFMTEFRARNDHNFPSYPMQFLDSMFCAQAIMEMAEHGWKGSNIWALKNGHHTDGSEESDYGLLKKGVGCATDPDNCPANEAYNTYYIYPYLTGFMGREMVSNTNDDYPNIRAYSTLDSSNDLTVMIVNNSASVAQDITINITGGTAGAGSGEMYELLPSGGDRSSYDLTVNGSPDPGWSALSGIAPQNVTVSQSFVHNVPANAIQFLKIPLTNDTPTVTETINPAWTPTFTATITPTPTITPTANPIFNTCDTMDDNGTWDGTDALRSINTTETSAITEGTGALQIDITSASNWQAQMARLNSFVPSDFSDVLTIELDVYVPSGSEPWDPASSYHELALRVDSNTAGKYARQVSTVHSLETGMNNIVFTLDWGLDGSADPIQPTDPLSRLTFIINAQTGATGTLYFDNIRITTASLDTPTYTATSSQVPTESFTPTYTSTGSATLTATSSVLPSATSTYTTANSQVPTNSFTPTYTSSASATATADITGSQVPTHSFTSTQTSTGTRQPTGSYTPTFSLTHTPQNTATNTPTATDTIPSGCIMLWHDEFDGPNIDTNKWTFETGNGTNGWGNNELEYYTDRPENARIENGVLIIEAREESYGGYDYTSARMKTQGNYSNQYGRIEAKIKLPYGQGIWPAFWMLGDNISTLGWPGSGEIDIMEMIGGGEGRDDTVHGTAHWDDGGHAMYGGSTELPDPQIFADDYHVFGIEWDSEYVRWYLDGTQYHIIDITPAELSELHNNFFLLLNVAVGGDWPGSPDGSTVFPQRMYVDWVRWYDCSGASTPTYTSSASATATADMTGSQVPTGSFTPTYTPQNTMTFTHTITTTSTETSGPAAINVTDNGPVNEYEKFEITFDVQDGNYTNPYDPADIDITVTFTGPAGTFTNKAFIYRDYTRSGDTSSQTLSAAGSPVWKARFAPPLAGSWTYKIDINDSGAGTYSGSEEPFTVNTSSKKGFVRLSSNDSRYLAYDNGEPYFAIGDNTCWSENHINTYNYDAWVGSLAAEGANFIRMWNAPWHTEVEWAWSYPASPSLPGNYDGRQKEAWALDYILDLCDANGVKMMLCLINHGKFSSSTNPNWDTNPYNSNVNPDGIITSPEQVWTDAATNSYLQRKWRYYISRYAYSTALMAWEFWNEMEWTDDYSNRVAASAAWHQDSKDYIRANDPHEHIVTTSYAHSQNWPADVWDSGMEIVQEHNYGGADMAEVVKSAATALMADNPGKPFIMGEMGIGGDNEGTYDPTGIYLHTSAWGALMAKSAGTAMSWWWDNYIHPNNLYYRYAGIASFVSGEDLDLRAYQPVRPDVSTSVVSDLTLSPGITGWGVQATANNFTVENSGAITPGLENLGGYLYGSWKTSYRNPPTFNVDYPGAGQFSVSVGDVSSSGTNTLTILLDGSSTTVNNTPVSNGNTYTIDVPSGAHTIYVEHAAEDWFQVLTYTLTDYSGAAKCYALNGNDKILGWVQNRKFTYWAQYNGETAQTISDGVISMTGVSTEGAWDIEWWDTVNGTVTGTGSETCSGGNMNISVPSMVNDIAFKAVYAGTAETPTFTPTITATGSQAATHSFTPTHTLTNSITLTVTSSVSKTITPTSSASATATADMTNSQVPTESFTPTFTPADSDTETATPTGTFSASATFTSTNSPVLSPTPTYTGTPPTQTFTPTITETYTFTGTPTNTFTATNSQVPTDSFTPTGTFTNTATQTITSTPSFTSTGSATPAATLTITGSATPTFTLPVSTFTYTLTPTPTTTTQPSATFTPAPTEAKELVIDKTLPYPNPYNPDEGAFLNVEFNITQNVPEVTFKLYTSAARLVRVVTIPGPFSAGRQRAEIKPFYLTGLSKGIYFYVITAKDKEGAGKRSVKIGKIIILK